MLDTCALIHLTQDYDYLSLEVQKIIAQGNTLG